MSNRGTRRLALLLFVAAGLIVAFGGCSAVAIEKRAYEVVEEQGRFELRSYPPAVIAETTVDGAFEDVGSEAFRILVAYISGANERSESISMTAPVTQEREAGTNGAARPGEEASGRYQVAFLMPGKFSLESLPQPKDDRITLRTAPAQRYAAIRYSGFWSRSRYEDHLDRLQDWIRQRGWMETGSPVWARYDPPFMPWFLRRNEILIPVDTTPG